jgi:hypothetical protein
MDPLKPTSSPKRDFLFIDESGDPGTYSPYYILGLLHITDVSLKDLNLHLGAMRYFGSVKREIKSSRVTREQREQLLRILRDAHDHTFVRASAIYLTKSKYQGIYLTDRPDQNIDPGRFQNLMMRRLLEHHFSIFTPQSQEVELIVDRFFTSELIEGRMRRYLRHDKHGRLPHFLHITQADSRYVELLQVADWIAGAVKERFFTHEDRDFADLFTYIKATKIVK